MATQRFTAATREWKSGYQAHGVLQGQCRSAENIRSRGGVVDQRRHMDPDQSVQASRVKQDVEHMNPARLVNLGALIGRGTGYICWRQDGCRAIVVTHPVGLSQMELEHLVRSRSDRPSPPR